MTGLIRLHIAMAALCLSVSIAVPVYYHKVYPDPPLLQGNAEFQRNVESIKDLEHLRKVLYTVVAGTDRTVVANKDVSDSVVRMLGSLAGLIAVVFAGSAFWLWSLKRTKKE
jgi:hypothetical protein